MDFPNAVESRRQTDKNREDVLETWKAQILHKIKKEIEKGKYKVIIKGKLSLQQRGFLESLSYKVIHQHDNGGPQWDPYPAYNRTTISWK